MSWISPYLSEIKKPEVLLALAGAFASALFGAWGGQRMVAKEQRRQAITAEISAINAALNLCFSTINSYADMKGQLLRPAHGRYLDGLEAFRRFKEGLGRGRGTKKEARFEWQLDYQTIPLPSLPTDVLQALVLEKTHLRGRGLDALIRLRVSETQLRAANSNRMEICKILGDEKDETVKMLRYFGLALPNGDLDQRYTDTMHGIVSYTDDCIYFTYKLSKDLLKYGTDLRRKYRWKRWGLQRLPSIDWTSAHNKKLIPPDEDYAAWLRGFVHRPTRWEAFKDGVAHAFYIPFLSENGFPDEQPSDRSRDRGR